MFNKRNINKILRWMLVCIWMFFIFHLSGEPANQSEKLSTGVTARVIETVNRVFHGKDLNVSSFDHVIRKCAHFSIYFLLGIFVLNALRNGERLGIKRLILSLAICALYASSDEFHQIFVSGRGPQVTDVFIDSTGAVVGIGFYSLLIKLFLQFKRKYI
jgi:VanZ family protein